ncbi:MAG TPA: heme lyase CcmF/NrfE family subunit [Tepidisphaeraceae bacterium]|nr:heme lyase CcmF/NrfE family subunit [Tepidisphaeraceae bacterium]
MTMLVGNFGLSMAMLAALIAFLLSVAAARFRSRVFLDCARGTIAAHFVLLSISALALLAALAGSDFTLDYVAHYTERALPIGYKLAAFWAGQEGSLLLWAWLLAAMSTIAVFTMPMPRFAESSAEPAAAIATLAAVCGFFAALMLFAANPFVTADLVPTDGHGLNPMLQNPGMIAHPPMLFLGYAGYTIPFALLVGVLVGGRTDNQWLSLVRPWAMVSWLFLSIGILLGAQWAYVELGWGGYWAWDPVENASLLPWLTGTALLHSIMIQQHRGMFKRWNASLVAVTFILCIFGTYITRSGVIDSVHSFGKSLIGTFFLVFLTASIAFSVLVMIARRKLLKPEHELEILSGREGFFLATNVLLVGMTVVTLVGTIFPLISTVLADQQVTVGPTFYNKVVAPLGLLLIALMAVGPLLGYGKDAAARLARGLIVPAIAAALAMAGFAISGLTNLWALIAAVIAAAAVTAVLVDLFRSVRLFSLNHQLTIVASLAHMLPVNRRRYAAQIVHVGVILIVIGITGSSLFSQKETFSIKQNDTIQFAGRTLTLTDLRPVEAANFQALQATLQITDSHGRQSTLTPQIRQYNKWDEQASSEVSIDSSLREDVYVTLASSDGKGNVAIQVIINPLVIWIWIGGVVLTLGGLIGLFPRLARRLAAVPAAPAPAPQVKSKKSRKNRGQMGVRASV